MFPVFVCAFDSFFLVIALEAEFGLDVDGCPFLCEISIVYIFANSVL